MLANSATSHPIEVRSTRYPADGLRRPKPAVRSRLKAEADPEPSAVFARTRQFARLSAQSIFFKCNFLQDFGILKQIRKERLIIFHPLGLAPSPAVFQIDPNQLT